MRYNPTFTSKEIQDALETLFGMGIEIITPTLSLLQMAVELVEQFDLTCYDATYLALSEELGFDFITADERFYRKIGKHPKLKTPIRLLSEFDITLR